MTLEQRPERVEPIKAVMAADRAARDRRRTARHGELGPTAAATCPRSRSRPSSWSARKT